MKDTNASANPRLLMAACVPAHAKSFGEWRSHAFDQFCLVTDGDVGLEVGSRKFEIAAPALVLIRKGERHGYWKLSGQNPHFWMLVFQAGRPIFEQLPALNHPDPGKRIWRLSTNQSAAFQGFFIRMVCERAACPETGSPAESAWFQLLMVTVQRWAEPKPWMQAAAPVALPPRTNGHARPAGAALEPLDFELPTYESLKHLFRKTFGPGHSKL